MKVCHGRGLNKRKQNWWSGESKIASWDMLYTSAAHLPALSQSMFQHPLAWKGDLSSRTGHSQGASGTVVRAEHDPEDVPCMRPMGQTNSLQSLTFRCAPVKPPLDRSTHPVHVSYFLPAIPADLSLPVSTRALLPTKLSLKGCSKVQGVYLLLLSSRQPKAFGLFS